MLGAGRFTAILVVAFRQKPEVAPRLMIQAAISVLTTEIATCVGSSGSFLTMSTSNRCWLNDGMNMNSVLGRSIRMRASPTRRCCPPLNVASLDEGLLRDCHGVGGVCLHRRDERLR